MASKDYSFKAVLTFWLALFIWAAIIFPAGWLIEYLYPPLGESGMSGPKVVFLLFMAVLFFIISVKFVIGVAFKLVSR